MRDKTSDNDDFLKKYEARQNETLEDFIKRYSSTDVELKDIIAYLIQHREMMRDVELERLEVESEHLMEQLYDNRTEQLLEEITCFKDILALQKKLMQENDKPRDWGKDKKAITSEESLASLSMAESDTDDTVRRAVEHAMAQIGGL